MTPKPCNLVRRKYPEPRSTYLQEWLELSRQAKVPLSKLILEFGEIVLRELRHSIPDAKCGGVYRMAMC